MTVSLPIIPESIAVGTVSAIVGFVMTDAMWALLVAQVGGIAIMIVKDRRDIRNREQDRLDRESAAKLVREEIAKVAVAGGERENRIVAKVEAVKEEVAKKSIPQEVHISNTESDPVPTKDAP